MERQKERMEYQQNCWKALDAKGKEVFAVEYMLMLVVSGQMTVWIWW